MSSGPESKGRERTKGRNGTGEELGVKAKQGGMVEWRVGMCGREGGRWKEGKEL